jgi:hypothetical protein
MSEVSGMKVDQKINITKLQSFFLEFFGLNRTMALTVIAFICLVLFTAGFWFFYSAPPSTITIASGPEGSMFRRNADKYATILARNHIKLKILDSEGSEDNLRKLTDRKTHVDIGFVQGGVLAGQKPDKLVSLGSVFYEPLLIFYRSTKPLELLSQFKGRRIAIGPEGSGTHTLALALLAGNGITPEGPTTLNVQDSDDAARALLAGKLDAVFLMGDSASTDTIRTLLRTPGILLFNFTQADAYIRRITYLNKLVLPQGSIDFGKNIPQQDINLIGPTVELIARPDLHPALSDLLIEAAREVHGNAGLLRRKGEFPAPLAHEFSLSEDASRYYTSGKTFFYRYLPFWMASLVNRFLLVLVPMIVVLIPGLKIIPALYRWRINLIIYRWYRALLVLEKDLMAQGAHGKKKELLERLDHIEKAVNTMKVPASFAEQFYVLRGHIDFVRARLKGKKQPALKAR